MRRLTGTIIFCRRCGSETRRDMVRAQIVNDLREAAETVLDMAEDEQTDIGSEVWNKAVAKLRALC